MRQTLIHGFSHTSKFWYHWLLLIRHDAHVGTQETERRVRRQDDRRDSDQTEISRWNFY